MTFTQTADCIILAYSQGAEILNLAGPIVMGTMGMANNLKSWGCRANCAIHLQYIWFQNLQCAGHCL